ncbi:MAG: YncE family protein [Adhaeribacter sp.]
MKKHSLFLKPIILAGIILLLAAGCHQMPDMDDMNKDLNINYPAAFVINGESNSISVIDLATNSLKETISLGQASMGGHMGGNMSEGISWPHHIYLNPVGSQLAIGVPGTDLSAGHSGGMSNMAGKAVIVDAKTGMITKSVLLPAMNHNATFSPNGTEIWTSQMEQAGKVLVYDANSYTLKNTIPVGSQPAEVTFSADGTVAFVANGGSNTVTAIRVMDKTILKTIPVGADPVGAWPGSDHKMYVDNEEGETVSVIDAASLRVEETIDLGFMPGIAALNGTSGELWVSDPDNGQVVSFQRENNAWKKTIAVATGAGAHAIAFTQDGKTAYVTNQLAGSVSVLNTTTKTKIKDIAVGKKPNGLTLRQ